MSPLGRFLHLEDYTEHLFRVELQTQAEVSCGELADPEFALDYAADNRIAFATASRDDETRPQGCIYNLDTRERVCPDTLAGTCPINTRHVTQQD